MVHGEGTEVIEGVTPQEVFDFVLDPAQYTKADTKILWVTKLGEIPNGMIAREDGTFLGIAKGSVITRYLWKPPHQIDVTLEHGFIRALHAWFETGTAARSRRATTQSVPCPASAAPPHRRSARSRTARATQFSTATSSACLHATSVSRGSPARSG